jgi:hypothetical protein
MTTYWTLPSAFEYTWSILKRWNIACAGSANAAQTAATKSDLAFIARSFENECYARQTKLRELLFRRHDDAGAMS